MIDRIRKEQRLKEITDEIAEKDRKRREKAQILIDIQPTSKNQEVRKVPFNEAVAQINEENEFIIKHND